MQFTIDNMLKNKTLKESAMSIPNTLYTSQIPNKNIEVDNYCGGGNLNGSSLFEMWNQQHPLIHTWLILSSISICFLSALLFIIH